MIPALDYSDIIKYFEKNGSDVICEDSHHDGLEELMLNRIIYLLLPKMPHLTKDEVVDLVYEMIYELRDPFTYYVSCVAAEGALDIMGAEDISSGKSAITDYVVSVLGDDYKAR